MKFLVFKDEFKKNFSQAAKTVAKKKGYEDILENVYIEAKEDKLILKSTDGEISTIIYQSAVVEEEGAICLEAKMGLEILNSLSWNTSENFEFITENNRVKIACGGGKAYLALRDAEDFPVFSPISDGNTFRMDFSNFSEAIKAVKASISRDILKENIRGVYVEAEEENSFNFVSTDTHRLAWKKIPVLSSYFLDDKKTFTIPVTAIDTLMSLSVPEAMELKAIYNESDISFYLDNVIITSSLIRGEFPDYKKVIPEKFNFELKLSKGEFQNSLKSVFPFSRSSNPSEGNGVEIKISKEKVVFFSSSPGIGTAEQELNLPEGALAGNVEDDFLIKFNIRYLLDAISPIEGEIVEIKFINSSAQVLFKDESRDDYFAIVMPMKIM